MNVAACYVTDAATVLMTPHVTCDDVTHLISRDVTWYVATFNVYRLLFAFQQYQVEAFTGDDLVSGDDLATARHSMLITSDRVS